MKKVRLSIVIFSLWILFSGCTVFLNPDQRHPGDLDAPDSSADRSGFMPEPYRQKALEYEKNGELQMALFYWRIAAALQPENVQDTEKIARLEQTLRRESDQHYKKGAAYREKGDHNKARQEFLAALRTNPDHREALSHLKDGRGNACCTTYTLKAGDTCQSTARKVYGSPEMDFLVAYFMEIEPDTKPAQGTVVTLPVLDTRIDRSAIDLEKELLEAKALLKVSDFAGVLSIVEKIRAHYPANMDAMELSNSVYYQMGQQLSRQQDYTQALKMFQKVDPDYKDTRKTITALDALVKKNAEMCYHKGINYFVHEELKKAIAEWEKTLALNPEHPKAHADIETARNLLEMLKKVE